MDQVEPNVTALERRVHKSLDEMSIDYVVHPKIRVEMFGKRRRLEPDVYVPSEHLVIEVNGCFAHGCPCRDGQGDALKRWKDDVRIEAFTRAGYEVQVVWEHDLT